MHDTPPPTRFNDGSFNVQTKDSLEFDPAPGGRFHYHCVPAGTTAAPFIAHLKVLKGNGEEIYFDEHAENSVIKIWLEKDVGAAPEGDLVITDGPNFFLIDADRKLKDPTKGNKGRNRYDHPGSGTGGEFHISRIKVEKPAGTVKLDVIAPAPAVQEEEYVVMVWHKGDHDHAKE